MWLGLCFVSVAPHLPPQNSKAYITHIETGEKYNFENGKFKQCKVGVLTSEEIKILEFSGHDIQDKQIGDLLKISKTCLARKKKSLFAKLGVFTANGAIYKAKDLGLI
jgi:ATP/maltotriose-dependent transcriptional regulator MalT